MCWQDSNQRSSRWLRAANHRKTKREMTLPPKRKRQNQDMHFLGENGMVTCNPRDREAAHRAEVEGIATRNAQAVTCRKCRAAILEMGHGPRSQAPKP